MLALSALYSEEWTKTGTLREQNCLNSFASTFFQIAKVCVCVGGCNVKAIDILFNHPPSLPKLRANSYNSKVPLYIQKIPRVVNVIIAELLYGEQEFQS